MNAYAMVGEVFNIPKSSKVKKILQNVLARVEEILTDVLKRSGMTGTDKNFHSVHAIKTKIHKGMMMFSLLADFPLAPACAACSGGITFAHCFVLLINSSETVNKIFSEKIVLIC